MTGAETPAETPGGIPARARDGASLLDAEGVAAMRTELHGDWRLEPEPDSGSISGSESPSRPARLERNVAVRDFAAALRLVNGIGAAAEDENHHPDLFITDYRNVSISLTTHDAGGLTANDFVLARRFDALAEGL